jgi:DNA polymerase-4
LAKMASDMKKPAGLTVIHPEDVSNLLWPLPVKELFGVGRRMARRLERLNINTIGELANAPEELLKGKFGLNGHYLYLAANGIDESPVDPHANDEAKSMGHSITLPQDVTSWGKAEAVLLNLSEKVGRRIRREDYMGRTVSIALRDNHFTTITRSKTIPYTSSTEDIYAAAKSLLHKNWDGKIPLRLLGVSISQLVKEFEQISLFDDNERKRKINKVVDDIKDRFGEKAIYRAKSQM